MPGGVSRCRVSPHVPRGQRRDLDSMHLQPEVRVPAGALQAFMTCAVDLVGSLARPTHTPLPFMPRFRLLTDPQWVPHVSPADWGLGLWPCPSLCPSAAPALPPPVSTCKLCIVFQHPSHMPLLWVASSPPPPPAATESSWCLDLAPSGARSSLTACL